ncbi:hypothetical protein [Robertkochia sediminum]|uniref:hypothetical protein n=1 Tax=Robertkochia sediminum TaxID=2785326 RepID=UPI001931A65E|nr:hypothetical protein [Robertkochia sediminum]MBL7473294.1 hypothetical protein [Robertkochia sediminum]
MKNLLKLSQFAFGALLILCITLSTNSSIGGSTNLFDDSTALEIAFANESISPEGGIVCKCNIYGKCKVNGSQDVCARFENNGFCSEYDSNCGYGG